MNLGKHLSRELVKKIRGHEFEDATLQTWGHSLNLSKPLEGEPKPVRFIGHWPRPVGRGSRFLFSGQTSIIAVEVLESQCLGDPRDMYSGTCWVYGQGVRATNAILYFPKTEITSCFSRGEEFEPAFVSGLKAAWGKICGRKAA